MEVFWVTATEGRMWQRSSCDIASMLVSAEQDTGLVYRLRNRSVWSIASGGQVLR